ncbi:MAG: leucyl aminopeptidase [Gaiellaceae bacterium]|nr:leucyl aminopeptidase [Gaiellaceae bacterium]
MTEYARLLVERCIDPEPGWQVLVATTTEARPLAQELSRLLAERGAYALTRIAFGGAFPVDLDWIEAAAPEVAPTLAPLERRVLDEIDGSIFVLAPEPEPRRLDDAAARAFRTHVTAYRDRGRAGTIPSVRCDFPCPAYAERADLTLEAFADVLYEACLRDWDEERRLMEPVRARLDAAREVRILGEETDLRLSLEGRTALVDDGHLNVPGGEVFTSPVEDSLEGRILLDVPSHSTDGLVAKIRLRFEGGEVVDASAETGEPALLRAIATDEGARRAGEFGVGCNRALTRPLRNVLFDEKMAGTVHLALGAGFPQLGGRNESALHWDVIKDLRGGGELLVDGVVVQRDGEWLP